MGAQITVFDSYGRFNKTFPPSHIHNIINAYVEKNQASLYINQKAYQASNTFICSHLSIYFILQRSRGHSLKCIQKNKFGDGNKFLSFLVPEIIECLSPLKNDVYSKTCLL